MRNLPSIRGNFIECMQDINKRISVNSNYMRKINYAKGGGNNVVCKVFS